MPKITIFIIFLIIILVGFYFWFQHRISNSINEGLPLVNQPIKGQNFKLEIARSITQQAVGLSNRASLCPQCGMIFVFAADSIQPFWMKDTLIPLDMIWINSKGEVVYIATANPEPNVSDLRLKKYYNDKPARYVIELNAGVTQNINLNIGDKIDLKI